MQHTNLVIEYSITFFKLATGPLNSIQNRRNGDIIIVSECDNIEIKKTSLFTLLFYIYSHISVEDKDYRILTVHYRFCSLPQNEIFSAVSHVFSITHFGHNGSPFPGIMCLFFNLRTLFVILHISIIF